MRSLNKSTIAAAALAATLAGTMMTRSAEGIRALDAAELARLNDKGRPLQRAMRVASFDIEKRTVELAFSSEIEAPRWFGIEILDHSTASVRMDRMEDGAALLMDHDWTDQIGVIDQATIDPDRRGRAVVRFSRSARAQEIFQDVIDGIRKHVSVGYRIHAAVLQEVRENDENVYRITDWEPYEISFVAVPLDHSVGVGRNALEIPQEEQTAPPAQTPTVIIETPSTEDQRNMKTKIIRNAAGALVRVEIDEAGNTVREIETLQTAEETRSLEAQGVTNERARVALIQDMGTRFASSVPNAGELAATAVREGATADAFRNTLLEAVNQRAARPLSEQTQGAAVGLSDADVRRYSFMRVIRALSNPTDAALQREAAFEFECSTAAERAYNKQRRAMGIVVPAEVLAAAHGERAFNASTAGGAAGNTGGYGIDTNLMTGSFVEMLRNRNTIMQLGQVMAGLVGNVDIPRQIAGSQGYWVGEAQDAGEGSPDLDQISLTSKTVAAYTDITRKLAMQSSIGVESLVRRDLAAALATTMDKAGYYGSGSANMPRGLANYAGVNAVPFASTKPTFQELVQMETEIASDNADVNSMAYVGNAQFRGNCKTTPKFGAGTEATIWEPGNTVNGYRTEITNQVQGSDVFFGNFADLIIGLWGGLDVTVDPYTLSKSGGLRIVCFQDVDYVLRRLESICLGRNG